MPGSGRLQAILGKQACKTEPYLLATSIHQAGICARGGCVAALLLLLLLHEEL
jgi:hypothetical protein